MNYKQLKITKYNNHELFEEEYTKRITAFGVIKTEMYPSLMKRETSKGKEFPLFVVPLVEIQMLSQEIQEKSNTIQKLWNELPSVAREQFYKEQLYKSVINTNEIEGVKTTRKEVSDAFNALKNKKNNNIRLLSTVRMYHDILADNFLKIDTIQQIRDIYDILTEGEIEEKDAVDGVFFRDGYVNILDENTGHIEHIPTPDEKSIIIMLSNWISFINDRDIPFLIKACLAHYFFENVHPFYDGNGRTGRYIFSRYLSRKLDIFSGLVISQKINENKKKYYDAFKITGDYDNRAEGTFFVLTMLNLLKDGQDDIIMILDNKKALLDNFVKEIESKADFHDLQKEILILIFQSTVFIDNRKEGIKDKEIIDILSTSYPRKTINDNIKVLREKGVITQVMKSPSRHILDENELKLD